MTISALVLARIFYELDPSPKFKYATLGLLFVNISVGGTMTHFAAPPVLMVASPWKWTTAHMLTHFGWKAEIGILLSNALYYLWFRKELIRLEEKSMLVRFKDEIQEKYLIRMGMDARNSGNLLQGRRCGTGNHGCGRQADTRTRGRSQAAAGKTLYPGTGRKRHR